MKRHEIKRIALKLLKVVFNVLVRTFSILIPIHDLCVFFLLTRQICQLYREKNRMAQRISSFFIFCLLSELPQYIH